MKTIRRMKKGTKEFVVKSINIFMVASMVFFQPGGAYLALSAETDPPLPGSEKVVTEDPTPAPPADEKDTKILETAPVEPPPVSSPVKASVPAPTAPQTTGNITNNDTKPADNLNIGATEPQQGKITPEAAETVKNNSLLQNNGQNPLLSTLSINGPASSQQTTNGKCMEDANGSNLQCTANDVSIASVSDIEILDDGCKFPGDTVTFKAKWNVQSGANERYDVGLYFAKDGQSNALNGNCSITTLANAPTPPWFNFDSDGCGDIDQNTLLHPEITLTVACIDPDGDNKLNLPYCTSWDNNKTGICDGPAQALPGTDSKCNCKDGFQVPITVPYVANIEVVKDLVPSSDSGRFNLKIDGNNEATSVGDGGSTGKVEVGAGTSDKPGATHTVSETAAGGTDLSDYASSISCVKRGTTTVVASATGTGPLDIPVQKNDDIVCTVTNSLQKASITVNKIVTNNNGGTATIGNFQAKLDGNNISWATPQNVIPGTYTVSETGSSGYSASYSGDCDANGSITIGYGENKTCIITNDDQPATLIVKKVVINDNGGTKKEKDFSFSVNGATAVSFEEDGQNDLTVDAGKYNVTEPAVAGYTTTYDNCANVIIPNGGTATCTITNDDIEAKLTVTKIVEKGAFGTLEVKDFPLFVGSAPVTSGVQNGFNAGDYIVSETSQPGYSSEFTGDCSSDGKITLAPGDVKECTITNTAQFGKIIVEKQALPDGSLKTFDFSGELSGSISDGQKLEKIVVPGAYSVSENVPSGWDLTDITCDDENSSGSLENKQASFNVEVGETVKCTFTNTQRGSITVKKTTDPDQTDIFTVNLGGDATDSTTIGNGGSHDFSDLKPGNYSITEIPVNGWQMTDISCLIGSQSVDPDNIDLGPGENAVCVLTNTKLGSITIIKDASPNDEQDFSFTTSSNLSGFTLDDDGDNTNTLKNNITFSSLLPDTYTFTEGDATGWDLTGVTCDNGQYDVTGKTLSVDFKAGENIICTFTNTKRGTITIEKQTLPDGSTQSFSFTPSYGSNFSLSDGQTNTSVALAPGNYSVSENVPTGWDQKSATCSDGSDPANIDLQAGEAVKCTFTNAQRGHIVVVKDAINNNAQDFTFHNNFGNGNSANFVLDDDGLSGSLTPNSRTFEVLPGTYWVSEDPVTGWQQESATCTNGKTIGNIDVGPGETVTCTFVNEQYAKIILKKNTVGDNGTFDFSMTGTGLPASTQLITTGNTASQIFSDIDQDNTYSITETVPDGWKLTSKTCTGTNSPESITPDPGEIITCTFTNTKDATLTLEKTVTNDNGGDATAADFQGKIDGNNVPWGVAQVVTATSHTVSETNLPGYTPSVWGGDCAAGGTVTLAPGENKTCTITNDDVAPKLTLVKSVTNDNGGNASPDDFKLTVGGTGVLSGVKNEYKANEPLAIDETQLEGYEFVSITGDRKCPDALGSTVTLSEGDDITCTITNNDISPTITLIKNVVGGTAGVDDFGISVGGNTVLSGAKTDVAANTPIAVNETGKDGYTFTSIIGDEECPEVLGGTVTLEEGDDITCTITNTRDTGAITVQKQVDTNGDGTYEGDDTLANSLGFMWGMDSEIPGRAMGSSATPLDTGNYQINEKLISDYHFTGWFLSSGTGSCFAPDGTTLPADVSVSKDVTTEITLCNARDMATVIVDKITNPAEAPDKFTINLIQNSNIIHTYLLADQDQPESFSVPTGIYSMAEDLANNPGWNMTGASCTINEYQEKTFNPTADQFTVRKDDNIFCTFNNQFVTPELKIDKFVGSSGNYSLINQNPGDTVRYILKIKASGGENGEIPNQTDVNNVQVTDLPPAGFVYVSGSATASSDNPEHSGPLELTHVYASPGVWSLGTMIPGEIITLEYDAAISDSQDAGNYPDLAWATGIDLLNNNIQATKGDPQLFAGTQVAVVVPEHNSVALVERTKTDTDTKHRTRHVRGSSIVLPATGSNTNWVILALVMLIAGLGLVYAGRKKKEDSDPMGNIATKIFILAICGLASFGFSGKVSAATINDDHLSVQIETPVSPMLTTDFQIGFVALNIDGKPVTVKCFEEGSATPFDTFSLAGGGTSGNCQIADSGIATSGIYKFYVTADAGSGVNETDHVTVDIDLAVPGTPLNYNRASQSCSVNFTTADDGITTAVELYRSTAMDFTADASTLASTLNIGPNTSGTITDPNADCGGSYNYAIRAISASGAGSGFVGDEKVNVHHHNRTKTTTHTTHPIVRASGGAIPVEGAVVQGETTTQEEQGGTVQGEEGQTEGAETVNENAENPGLFSGPNGKYWIGGIIAALAFIYYVYTRTRKKPTPPVPPAE